MSTFWEMLVAITLGYIAMEALVWAAQRFRQQGEAFLARKAKA
jgi:hypothetical protein